MSPLLHVQKPGVGERLAGTRRLRGMSQRELARATPYTAAYVSRIEANARTPTRDALQRFASALGVSASFLETGEDVVDLVVPRDEARALLVLAEDRGAALAGARRALVDALGLEEPCV